MPTTAATVVGNKFVFEYYTTLSQKPEEIVTFYKAESTLTSGYGSFEMNASNEQEVEIVHGAQVCRIIAFFYFFAEYCPQK